MLITHISNDTHESYIDLKQRIRFPGVSFQKLCCLCHVIELALFSFVIYKAVGRGIGTRWGCDQGEGVGGVDWSV